MSTKCAATTAKGLPCKNKALDDSQFCRVHFKDAPTLKIEPISENESDDDEVHSHSGPSTSTGNTRTNSTSITTTNTPNMVSNPLYSLHKKGNDNKKIRNMTEKGAIQKAMMLYYHEHKKDSALIEDVKERLAKVGLLHNKTIRMHGVDIEVPDVPWLVIKLATDYNFIHHLSHNDRMKYINSAKQLHHQKYRM